MKKVLFLATRPIYPMKDGRTYLIEQYCNVISNFFNMEIIFACFDYNNSTQPEYLKKIYCLDTPKILEQLRNSIIMSLILRKWPFQVSLMFCKKTKKHIENIIEDEKPDILVCDMARLAPYVENINIYKVLDMDDLLSKRYERQSQLGNLDENVLGQFKNNIPFFLLFIISKFHLVKKLLLCESRLLKRFEVEIARKFDKTFFCSPTDMDQYNRNSKITANCVHVAISEREYDNSEYLNCQIAYLGNIDIAANRDSLKFLLDNIMPVLNKNNDDKYKLLVIGRCSEENISKFSKYNNVEFTGAVDDIYTHICKCCALVAPIQYGSGIKIKIIEAMSMGIPVITNALGVEGLNVKNNENIIICSDIKEYLKSIVDLSNNPDYRNRIATNAKEYVRLNHSIEICKNDLRAVLNY